MRYSEMTKGSYIIRTRELKGASILSGAICYVCDVSSERLVIQLTDDCRPVGDKFALGSIGDDSYWHETTELVLDANSVILPPLDELCYDNNLAPVYRNFLGLKNVEAHDGEDASGRICLIGEEKDGSIVFSKAGYFVVAHSDGWYTAYQGFCDSDNKTEEGNPILRVLRLGSSRKFYEAAAVIAACNSAVKEDIVRTVKYTEAVMKEVATASKSRQQSGDSSDINRLQLEGE